MGKSPSGSSDPHKDATPTNLLTGSHVKSFVDRLRHQTEVHEEESHSPLLGSHVKSFVDQLRHQSEVDEQESHGVAQVFVASIDPGLILEFGSRC